MGTYSVEKTRENAARIREAIARAAQKAGRPAGEVVFCAVSKTRTPAMIAACNTFDFDIFGENRVNELKEKILAGAYGQKPVHLIGKLQTNKVKDVVGRVEIIHSVDSSKLLLTIEKEAAKRELRQDVLVEVNIGGEESKGGVPPAALEDFLARAGACAHIRVRGLMSIPPNVADPAKNRINLQSLYRMFIDMKGKKYDNVSMDLLSMGMSRDFEDAILCGANLVRIGSALFGPRDAL